MTLEINSIPRELDLDFEGDVLLEPLGRRLEDDVAVTDNVDAADLVLLLLEFAEVIFGASSNFVISVVFKDVVFDIAVFNVLGAPTVLGLGDAAAAVTNVEVADLILLLLGPAEFVEVIFGARASLLSNLTSVLGRERARNIGFISVPSGIPIPSPVNTVPPGKTFVPGPAKKPMGLRVKAFPTAVVVLMLPLEWPE